MNKLILNENVTMSSMDIKLKDIGHVYFLLDKDRSLVKIGKSKKPEQRVASLITLLGIKSFDYFISKKIVNYSTIETLLHQEFKGGRVLGEWFQIDYLDAVNFFTKLDLVIATNPLLEEAKNNQKKSSEHVFSALKGMVTNNHNNAKESPLINGYMQISGALSMFINGLKNNQMVIEELDKKFSGFKNLKESHSQLNLLLGDAKKILSTLPDDIKKALSESDDDSSKIAPFLRELANKLEDDRE